jgi:hypothetical protein
MGCLSMTKVLLASTLVIAVAASEAEARVWDFKYTGEVVTWEVPHGGKYRITAWGAQGGALFATDALGAEIGGRVFLTRGTVLKILVGGGEPPGGFSAGAAEAAASFPWLIPTLFSSPQAGAAAALGSVQPRAQATMVVPASQQ